MGLFANNALTDVGRILLSYVQMGAIFTPTKIVMGSGYLPAGTTVRTITNVVTPVKTLTITKKERSNDGTVVIGGVYSNADITANFYFRELALYAKAVDEDGTEVCQETLYAYGNAGSAADLMPAYSSGQAVEREIDVATYIGNDSAVNLFLESGVYLTQEQAEELIDDKLEQGIDPGNITVNIPGIPETTLEQIIVKLSPILQVEGDNIQAVLNLTHAKSGTMHTLTGLGGLTGLVPCYFKATAEIYKGEPLTIDGVSYTLMLLTGETVSGSGADDGARMVIAEGASVVAVVDTTEKTMTVQNNLSDDLYLTFTAAGWTGSAPPYTQTIDASGVSLDLPAPRVSPNITTDDPDTAMAQMEGYSMMQRVAVTEDGKIMGYCYEDKPAVNVPVIVQIVR